jgi:16S rRNA U516 pseudouridylate synthase RsuA-like enzyme
MSKLGANLRQLLVRANISSMREAAAYDSRGWAWHDPDGQVPLGAAVARGDDGGLIVAIPGGGGVVGLDKRAVHDQHSRLGGVVLNKPYSFLSHHTAGSRSRDAKTILTANNGPSGRGGSRGSSSNKSGGHTTFPSVCAWAGADPASTPDLHVTGRLDADSTGLLVFTRSGLLGRHLVASGERGAPGEAWEAHGEGSSANDGGMAFEKEYLVRVSVNGNTRQRELDAAVAALAGGRLELDGEQVRPAVVRWLHPGVLQFVMSEGRHRQIRRMCELVRGTCHASPFAVRVNGDCFVDQKWVLKLVRLKEPL